jgi:MFS family permease
MLGADRSPRPAPENAVATGIAAATVAESISAAIWGPERRALTAGLILIVSMAAFEALAVATVLPAVVQHIGGLEWYGWVFSAFMLANLVSITTAGHAADRQGLARPFVIGSALFAIGLLGAGIAPKMPVLVASRVAQGLGAGAFSSVSYVAIARAYPAHARPRMLAMLSSAWVVPGLIGPALRRLSPLAATPSANHTLAALRLSAGTAALLFGLGSADLRLGALAVVLGSTLALPALARLLPAGTLRAAPGLPAAVATLGLLGCAFFAAEAFLPLSLTDIRGQSTMVSGIALTATTIMWTAGAWVQARLVSAGNRRRLTAGGLLLIIAGIAGIAAVATTTVPVALAAIAWGVAGLGMGLAYSTATLVVLEAAPAGNEGASASAAQLANVLGTALGTGVGGAIVMWAAVPPAQSTRTGIALVDASAIAAAMLALLTARRLGGGAQT